MRTNMSTVRNVCVREWLETEESNSTREMRVHKYASRAIGIFLAHIIRETDVSITRAC